MKPSSLFEIRQILLESKMAEETKKVEAAPAAEKVKKKKTRPTNCAQSNKRIRRKDWYYRNGRYFANKQCFILFTAAENEKKAKEAAAAATTTEAPAQ